MIVDPKTSSGGDVYRLLVSCIVPRPIAFVSTISKSGITNLAPYSFFNGVHYSPALLCFSVVEQSRGDLYVAKDTQQNIEDNGEFVVNVAVEQLLDCLNQSSASYDASVSEIDELGFTPIASDLVAPPRIAESPVSMECRLSQIVKLGERPAAALVIGEIVRFHIADDVWDAQARMVDAQKLQPLSRLGGSQFATVGEVIERPRPKTPPRTG